MIAAIGIFFVFLLLGMPVAFAIGISGWSFFMIRELPLSIMVQKSISTTQSFTMLAIPLFILAGNLMNASGITKRLMNVANVLWQCWKRLGWVISCTSGPIKCPAVRCSVWLLPELW